MREREGEHAVGAISWGRKGEMRWPDLKERKKRKPERALFLPRQFKNSEKDFPLNKAHSRFAGRDFFAATSQNRLICMV
jgi:hypothetical protein